MRDVDKLAECFDKHLNSFEAIMKKVKALEDKVIELEKIILNVEMENKREILSINDTISWFSKETEKAVDMANKALYYIPNTTDQMESIIYNKVSAQYDDRLKKAVKLEMDNLKWQLSEFFRD